MIIRKNYLNPFKKGIAKMQKESQVKDQDPNQENDPLKEVTAETPCQGILDATDIKIEEVSIDGICGVY